MTLSFTTHRHERHWKAHKPHLLEEPDGPDPQNSVTNVCNMCVSQGQWNSFELKLRVATPNSNFMAQFFPSVLTPERWDKLLCKMGGKKGEKSKIKEDDTQIYPPVLGCGLHPRTLCWRDAFLVPQIRTWGTWGEEQGWPCLCSLLLVLSVLQSQPISQHEPFPPWCPLCFRGLLPPTPVNSCFSCCLVQPHMYPRRARAGSLSTEFQESK